MKTMAVICEYNPFHNGHKYQLEKHKEYLGADAVICLMSGSFVQRGAPAVYDKWTRAQDAVKNGADLVIELPVVYSCQSAMRFAYGAVKLLDKLNIVDYLSFGSECGDTEALFKMLNILNTDEFNDKLNEKLNTGLSFPSARSEVLAEFYPDSDISLVDSPNNILALEYISALNEINSKIEPKTIKRNSDFVSASYIRQKMDVGESVSSHIPTTTRKTYDKTIFESLVLYNFRKESQRTLQSICDMTEGLENKFKKASQHSASYDELAEAVKSKRYTRTRIDRICVNSLLEIQAHHTEMEPQYVRVLAFNEKGQALLSLIKKASALPIITKVADAKPTCKDFEIMLKKDLLATDVYSILTHNPGGLDFKTSPIKVK